jgi:proteic killer suppression protein
MHSKKLPSQIQRVSRRKLKHLEYAININDLRVPPANRLEELKGDRKGKHSIRINQQWRIVFRWDNGAHDIEIVDYH